MIVEIRPASLQDGVAVLSLLEDVGYYPEPVSYARTFRRTITDPGFLVRVAESEDGRVVGVATLALRYQLGLGGLIASLDELAIAAGAPIVPLSLPPFTPSGLLGAGLAMKAVLNSGRSAARGRG